MAEKNKFDIVTNRKAKSTVWEHFGLKKIEGKLVENVAVCRMCMASVKYSGGTTNLSSHIRARHPNLRERSNDDTDSKNTQQSGSSGLASTTKETQVHDRKTSQCTLPTVIANKTPYPPGSRRATEITETITNFLINDMRPFKTVDTDCFRKMLHTLDPRYKVPGRKHFSQIAIPKKYEQVKGVVKGELQRADQVAITTDGWTSRATESYITITSTHINNEWQMVNYVLMTRCMPESHTGVNIAEFLKEAIAEWGIKEEPLYLVSDNASNMKKAAEVLGCDLHLGCFAHTLNLAAQKGLRVKAVSNLLAKIRKIVGFFHRSTVAAARLQTQATNLNLPNHKLVIDVPTRWNSAFDMLERYLEMQVAVVATLMSLANKDKDLKFLSDEEISLAEKVMEAMKPLKQATTMLCNEKSPTISIILPLHHKLVSVYKTSVTGETTAIVSLKAAIVGDLENRYDEKAHPSANSLLMKATVLDPRFKALPYLEEERRFTVYNDLVKDLASLNPQCLNMMIKKEPGALSESIVPNVEIQGERHVDTLPPLPSLPKQENQSAVESVPSTIDIPSTPKKAKQESFLNDLLGDVFVTKVENVKSPLQRAEIEVQKYKDLPSPTLESSPLQWWKENQNLFPLLSCAAKQLLCIPSTSVPSERVFSTAGDIVSSQRANLKASTVDMLIFLKKNCQL
ncbi:zinc finger BED domain-containing protein 1-like [Pecten maximus]|uniref:zinc finger BED domain-containing protein 1-like n=1 Tax=Pecten maximus TaxID=6579 RepID=UPI001458CB55|nr:zinc finger BED domain-containing protein 1-like [Pecten maximus]XP_033743261.1 zinc finger BED domain-containing protein 1-like [Pecten maximus]XP_033745907.1 zinc finger BED domain-containing protein 1-like [Pecten maximus]XP_033755378.1 zinc finger BED domain-containing protein 1-like [Pecten maximus]XP_033759469.1 zinc finger BED domain-containing protein 1-like [Pecten maximus]XP_033760584.1 zinc finger BED domain-containing protein 1-like [Pecten maximus]